MNSLRHNITGRLSVEPDLETRRLADPIPATVDGHRVVIAREAIPDGLKVGDQVTVLPIVGTVMFGIVSFVPVP